MLIVYADGIGTARLAPDDGRSILMSVVRRLVTRLREQGKEVTPVRVEWPASMAGIGGNLPWDKAAAVGVADLNRIVRAHPGEQVILLGYSGGCKVIHDWLDSRPLENVAAVGLLSDPFRPADAWQSGTLNPHGSGICGGQQGPIPDRTYWTSYWEDVISSCPDDSPLRTFADLSDQIPGGFLDDFGGHLRLSNWQLANYIKLWKRDPLGYLFGLGRRMDLARRGVEGYLTGAHTTAYTREFVTEVNGVTDKRPLTHRLADTISYRVRKDLKA